jgi:hypothetical protein
MPADYSGADALKIEPSGVLLESLQRLGEVPGVVIDRIAGRNGEGIGELTCIGADKGVGWKAPGSSRFGAAVVAAADGFYLLEDGEDASKWVRVYVYRDYLITGRTARVYLKDRYENRLGYDDITAGEATAGDVSSWTLELYNAGASTFHQFRVWIDAAVSGLDISDDGASWVAPTTKETALELPDLGAGLADMLHLRRTIVAGAVADPKVLNRLHFAFQRV